MTLCWGPAPKRSRAVPGAVTGTAGEVRAGTTPGKDAPDRVRALRRRAPEGTWQRKTGDLPLFGFHPPMWDEPEGGPLHDPARDHWEAHGRQAERNQGEAAPAHARVHRGHPEVVAVCGEGVFPISRRWPSLPTSIHASSRTGSPAQPVREGGDISFPSAC